MSLRLERFWDEALKIRPGEGQRVLLMALYSASTIGAMIVGRTARDALFLAGRSASDLAPMYVVNAVVVALVLGAYARFADAFARHKLNAVTAFIWAGVMGGLLFGLQIAEGATAWLLYVLAELMGTMIVIQFWTFAQDIFNAREAKRLFGLIGAGGQAANVFYGFLAAGLSRHFGAESLLVLSAANLLACGGFAILVGRRFGGSAQVAARLRERSLAQRRQRPKEQSTSPRQRFSSALNSKSFKSEFLNPHLLALAAIAVVGAFTVNLVDFQFKAAAEQHIDSAHLGSFFGQFYALCGAAALLIQLGLTGRVLEKFGILASLLPLPIGIAVGSLTGLYFPSAWTASLAKGSDSILRFTLNDASMQLLYVPIPAHARGRAKAITEGILRPVGAVSAGALLVWLSLAPHSGTGPSPEITTVVVAGTVVWLLLLVWSRREYLRSLMDTLQHRKLDLHNSPLAVDHATAQSLARVLRGEDVLAVLNAVELIGHASSWNFTPELLALLRHPVSSVRHAAARALVKRQASAPQAESQESLELFAELRLMLGDPEAWCVAAAIEALCALRKEGAFELVSPFIHDPRPGVRTAVVVGLVRHAGLEGILFAADELKRQLQHETEFDRELAAAMLGSIGVREFYSPLLKFLDDPSPRVKRAAVIAAGRLRSPQLLESLLPALGQQHTAHQAAQALARFQDVEDELCEALLSKDLSLAIRAALPSVLARIGTRKAAQALGRGLASTSPSVRAACARSLARLRRERPELPLNLQLVRMALAAEISEGERLLGLWGALGLHQLRNTAPTAASSSSSSSPPTSPGVQPSLGVGRGEKPGDFEEKQSADFDSKKDALAPSPTPPLTPEDAAQQAHEKAELEALHLLSSAVLEEKDRAVQCTITMLSLLYPSAELDRVAENLKSEFSSQKANAVEVLDNAVESEFKSRLLGLIENQLDPSQSPASRPDLVLARLIEGQYSWIAACAAHLLRCRFEMAGSNPGLPPELREALFAALSSPAPYLREACAHALIRAQAHEPELGPWLQQALRNGDRSALEALLAPARGEGVKELREGEGELEDGGVLEEGASKKGKASGTMA